MRCAYMLLTPLVCTCLVQAQFTPLNLDPLPAKADDIAAVAAKEPAKPKLPTANVTGQFQADSVWFLQDAASRTAYGLIPNGSAFRRARLGVFGDYGVLDYRIEADFALSGRPSLLDVFARVSEVPLLGQVRLGHFFEPFSLERVTPNRFNTFLERNLADQAFVPARNLGIMVSQNFLDQRTSAAFGVFRSDSDAFGDDSGNRFESAFTARITGLPVFEDNGEHLLHLGLGYSFRGPNQGFVQFRAQPEARIGATSPNVPFLVDTGRMRAEYYHLIGPEVAGVYGPLSMQAEAILVPVQATNGESLFFSGWYVEVACFLTGEHRPYRKSNGTFERVTPLHDAISANKAGGFQGPGAVQVAWRVSQLNLSDGRIRGGRLTDMTTGVNWHLNPFLRLSANYILAVGDETIRGRTHSHGFGLRLGFEF